MDLRRNAALQCVKFGFGKTERKESWQIRFNILECIRNFYVCEDMDDRMNDVSDSFCSFSENSDDSKVQ